MQSYTHDTKIKAMLSYLAVLNVVFFFTEKDNHFIRYHSAQSIVLYVALIAANILFGLLGGIWLIGFLFRAALTIFNIVWFLGALFCAIRAYNCDMARLPYIDSIVKGMLK